MGNDIINDDDEVRGGDNLGLAKILPSTLILDLATGSGNSNGGEDGGGGGTGDKLVCGVTAVTNVEGTTCSMLPTCTTVD